MTGPREAVARIGSTARAADKAHERRPMTDRDNRPSPEALLERRDSERAAGSRSSSAPRPGVGKTYEMLAAAQAKRRDGVDVVVGIVETHGRQETEALLAGLEVIPRRRIEYRGRTLDGDGSRRDPRAAPAAGAGRRAGPHERARQPAPEALSRCRRTAGSGHRRLHDAQHPARRKPERCRRANHPHPRARDGARFRHRPRRRYRVDRSHARGPDPAPEGRQGLRAAAGRAGGAALFHARQSHRAARACPAPHRAAGRRADGRPICARTRSRAPGPPASACSSASTRSRAAAAVVRYARRLADRLRAPWTAVHVETARSPAARARRSATASPNACGLAQRLGGETVTVPGQDVAQGLVEYAQANNFTHIVIAKSRRSRWSELWRSSVTYQLIRRAGDISVHVIAEQSGRSRSDCPEKLETAAAPSQAFKAASYVGSLGVVAAALAVGLFFCSNSSGSPTSLSSS